MIIWHRKAIKDLTSLLGDVQKRIKTAVEKLPRESIKPLTGTLKGTYRLKVAQWHMLFFFQGVDLVIFHIKHRKDAYQ